MGQMRTWLGAWLMIGASAAACGEQTDLPHDLSKGRSADGLWSKPLEGDASTRGPSEVMPLSSKVEAYGTDLGHGNYHVDVRHPDGFTVFSSDFEASGGQYRVGYTLFSRDLKAGSSAIGSSQLSFPLQSSDTSLESALGTATYLYMRTSKEANGNYATDAKADFHGCDLGVFGARASCSDRGACCEVHDQCFEKNGCSGVTMLEPVLGDDITSWLTMLTELKLTPEKVAECQSICNGPVSKCMLQLEGPGTAPCCANDTCGQPRVPGVAPKKNARGDRLFGAPAGLQVPKTKKPGGNFFFGRHVQTGKDTGAPSDKAECAPDDKACEFVTKCDPESGEGCDQQDGDAPRCDEQTGQECDGDGLDHDDANGGGDGDLADEDGSESDESSDRDIGEADSTGDDDSGDGEGANTGEGGSGENTGNEDTGDQDTGDQDTGDQDTGDESSGDESSGDESSDESGDEDTGDQETGDEDSGGDDYGGDEDYGGDDYSGDEDYGGDDYSGE